MRPAPARSGTSARLLRACQVPGALSALGGGGAGREEREAARMLLLSMSMSVSVLRQRVPAPSARAWPRYVLARRRRGGGLAAVWEASLIFRLELLFSFLVIDLRE
jgi:hypothetical protein